MGLFSKLKKTDSAAVSEDKMLDICAPISGKVLKIEDVPDVVFSEKIVGDGIAIQPTSNKVVAPIDGTIGKVFDTKHAFSIISGNGVEIFVHVGVDTVELKGEGFTQIAQDKQVVKKGEVILELDLDYLEKNAKSTITPVVISNTDEMKTISKEKLDQEVQAGEDVILRVVAK